MHAQGRSQPQFLGVAGKGILVDQEQFWRKGLLLSLLTLS